MGFLSWIIFGAIAGWIASIITGRSNRMGCFANIFAGVLGAFIGGFVMSYLGPLMGMEITSVTGFNWPSFGIAVLGAIIFLSITGWRADKEKRKKN